MWVFLSVTFDPLTVADFYSLLLADEIRRVERGRCGEQALSTQNLGIGLERYLGSPLS